MASQTRSDTAPPKIAECPECGSNKVIVTMKTSPGFYCLCEHCGHIWHADSDDAKPADESTG